MEKLKQRQNELIEEIGVRLESRLNVAPLAARIYALLTLSSYDGLSFEQIREIIGSSKSSTSVNLNVLKQLKYIEYHTKQGDRKRYFRVAKYFQLISLQMYHESLENDIKMVDKINTYNKEYYPEKFINEKSLGDITQDYMRKMQGFVKETIQKISKHQDNNL